MAGPIRFRHATDSWSRERVERALRQPLDAKFGAQCSETEVPPPPGFEARRLSMGNGDFALVAWRPDGAGAYWLGNTETPEALWRTNKKTFAEAPYPVARWGQRELLTKLEATEPWLASYEHVAWFFLPVLFSKDGRDTTRAFFRDHAAGFPDTSDDAGVQFYERFLSTGVLDDHRYTMASKLGTSDYLDRVRMRATMGEIDAAKLLADAGYEFVPEVELDSGHALDYRIESEAAAGTLVEVTRPEPPARRRAGTPEAALRGTVENKTSTQLAAHDGAVLLVDCTSFRDDEWAPVRAERPAVGYDPAVVYRMRPDGSTEGYTSGVAGLDIDRVFANRQTP